jgi:protein-tyrosine phosphatase
MTPDLFWIPGPWTGRLAISTRPRGGDWLEDEIRGWRNAGIDTVVSLLDPEEEGQLELAAEGRLATGHGIHFISFPVADRGVPVSLTATISLIRELGHALEKGKMVAVHCRQGIGRSALIAAGALIDAGVEPDSALDIVGSARGLSVPETPEQRRWVRRLLADNLAVTSR